MRLGLRMGLNSRGAGGGGDIPSLDLQFATDKSLTARKGPTPVFTRASTATFVGSDGLIQSAAINAARFDHDPSTLVSKGLLIEESRTNTLIQSNDFANAAWAKSNITIGSTTNLSPDGSNNATLLIAGTAPVSWIFRSGITASGSTVTFFAKSSGKRWAVVDASSGAGTAGVWFDLQNGVVGTVQSGYTASIQQFPNGFYRCRVTYPSSGAGTFCVIGVSDNDGLFVSTGSGSNGIILYGAQLEAGAFPTSYIPTTTASVVRSADVCSIGSIASFYGSGVGTILVGTQFNGANLLNGVCGFYTGANQISIGRLVNNTRAATFGTAPALTINSGTLASTLFVKSAFAFNTNDAAFANNGVSAGTSSSVGIPSVTSFGIGSNGSQVIQSGTISEIKVFKKRLANAKLLTITT